MERVVQVERRAASAELSRAWSKFRGPRGERDYKSILQCTCLARRSPLLCPPISYFYIRLIFENQFIRNGWKYDPLKKLLRCFFCCC